MELKFSPGTQVFTNVIDNGEDWKARYKDRKSGLKGMVRDFSNHNKNYYEVIHYKDKTVAWYGEDELTLYSAEMINIDMNKLDLTVELWREYDFSGRIYRIDNPISVEFRSGGSTHRVVDAFGVVHCVPAPGFQGCVLRWKSIDETKPVAY